MPRATSPAVHQPHNMVAHIVNTTHTSADSTSCMWSCITNTGRRSNTAGKNKKKKKTEIKKNKKKRHGTPSARDAPHHHPCTNRTTSSHTLSTPPIRARTARHACGRVLPSTGRRSNTAEKKQKKEKKRKKKKKNKKNTWHTAAHRRSTPRIYITAAAPGMHHYTKHLFQCTNGAPDAKDRGVARDAVGARGRQKNRPN